MSRTIPEAPFDAERARLREAGEQWKICRWCGVALSGRRTAWCSQAHTDEYLIRRSPGIARVHVGRRDRGVCALCGRDTRALERFWGKRFTYFYHHDNRDLHRRLHRAWRRMKRASLGVEYRRTGYWDMDHIVPVVEGGGGCGLDNLRTLCIPCHRDETAELAKRRAAGHRPQRELALEKTG